MPIRFRCAYCNQLLGIAHRKAGTVVRCPTCAGQVVVPNPQDAAGNVAPAPGERMLFERQDFDEVFNPTDVAPRAGEKKVEAFVGRPPAASAAPPAPAQGHAATEGGPPQPGYDVEPVAPHGESLTPGIELAPALSGVLVTRGQITLLAVAAIVALLLAFGAGLLVGLSLRSSGPGQPASITAVTATLKYNS